MAKTDTKKTEEKKVPTSGAHRTSPEMRALGRECAKFGIDSKFLKLQKLPNGGKESHSQREARIRKLYQSRKYVQVTKGAAAEPL